MRFVNSSHMSYVWSKGALNYCIRREWEHLNVAQWKYLSSIETSLPKPFWSAWCHPVMTWLTSMKWTHIYNPVQESKENEPPRKRFKHFNILCNSQQQENSASPVAPQWYGNKEISTVGTVQKKWHWILSTIGYKRIYTFCFFLFLLASSAPASTAAVELFSQQAENLQREREIRTRNFATQKQNIFALKFKVTLLCIH